MNIFMIKIAVASIYLKGIGPFEYISMLSREFKSTKWKKGAVVSDMLWYIQKTPYIYYSVINPVSIYL